VTPPTSPRKRSTGLISPKKCPRIPLTPHRPNTDKFWSQDVINEWNDEFSPRKPPKAWSRIIEEDESRDYLPCKTLKNRSTKRNIAVLEAKKSFQQRKCEIAEAFLTELDRSITAGKITEMTASTGGVTIIWSKKLNTTAGRANWRREALKPVTEPEYGSNNARYRHYASIELAEKVIDDEVRLLNVIAHEFCHLANFMVSGVMNNPHGKEFKIWAEKCSRRFGNRGIEVTTKHSYDIDYKYVWECENCGSEFKRHSRSINPTRHWCSLCKGGLTQKKPVPRVNRVTNEYQMFVKENMKMIRQENPESPQKDIMGMVGKRYQEYKASKLIRRDGEASKVNTGIEKALGPSGVITPDTFMDAVVGKLDLLDLTSP
jgi:predicted SprT family Zn-dependent metalloprotease